MHEDVLEDLSKILLYKAATGLTTPNSLRMMMMMMMMMMMRTYPCNIKILMRISLIVHVFSVFMLNLSALV